MLPHLAKKVLVVDDKECIRTSTSLILEEMGYFVRSAEDGLSALAEIRQDSPDILLTDLNMPGMSGFELLTEVRSLFPAIKVIAMSGAFCGSEIPPGVLADAFYQKGGSVSTLLKILRALPRMKCRSLEHPVQVHPSPFGAMQVSLSVKIA